MKNLNFISLIVVLVMMVGLTNCKKDLRDSTPVSKQYVDLMDASFNVLPAVQLTSKDLSADPNVTLTSNKWYTYTNNGTFYSSFITSSNPYVLIKGLEFITGSIGYNFWSVDGNNPITLAGSVFQNQIPIEPIRLAVEGLNAQNQVAFIGMRDFTPPYANFPMDIQEYRLGDKVTINADQLFALHGGTLTINVSFGLAPIELEATKMQSTMTDGELGFNDIKLGASVQTSKQVVNGGTTLYSGLESKVTGPINIVIVENWDGLDGHHTATITLSTNAFEYGRGMNITLTTTKLGWYDSAVSAVNANDIQVVPIEVPVE